MQRKIRRIYCDTAAATPLAPAVFQAMKPWFGPDFGNPSSLHQEGLRARKAVDLARSEVAGFLNVRPDEVVFTGNGSEANTLALVGLAATLSPGVVITTTLEHSSVRNSVLELASRGWKVKMLKPDQTGAVLIEDIEKALQEKGDKIISITFASNEIGTIQPLKEVAKIIRRVRKQKPAQRIIFHTDACQAARFSVLDPAKLGVDALTFNGAKMYGPKGIGVLWLKRGLNPRPQIFGGGQEGGRRSGTEAVPQIIGLAAACRLVAQNYKKENALLPIQKYFVSQINRKISGIEVNGLGERLPHIVNLQIRSVDAEQLVIELDARGIAVSAGSACSSHKRDSSYVIMSLGRSAQEAKSAIRFSFGCDLKKKEVDWIVRELELAITRLRALPKFS